MEDKKTSLAVWEKTLQVFNTAKYKNGFKTADDFILFLLLFYEKNKEIPPKPHSNLTEKQTFK